MNFNPEAPTFLVMLLTALFAFFLSSVIAITYQFTTKSIHKKAHFLQSLALIGIAAATILQAIGESVAIGLGIIGALSIIRFRTSLADPRNITFTFASIGAGIACGVMGFGIALTGTLVFCTGAIILRFSPLSNENELIGVLKLRVPRDDDFREMIEKNLEQSCSYFELDSFRLMSSQKKKDLTELEEITQEEPIVIEEPEIEKLQEFVYLIRLRKSTTINQLEERFEKMDGLKSMRLNFQKKTTKL